MTMEGSTGINFSELKLADRYVADSNHKIGSGGQSEIFPVTDTRMDQKRVIKVAFLMKKTSGTEQDRESKLRMMQALEKEAKLLASVDDIHLVKVFDFVKYDEGDTTIAGIVLEPLLKEDGWQTLQEFSRSGGLTIDDLPNIFDDVAAALKVLKAKGILHRDLKPANIFFNRTSPFRTKLIDLGVTAKPGEDELPMNGTRQFMSPEQFFGLSQDFEEQSQVFSLALTAFQLLTGTPFFQTAEKADLAFLSGKDGKYLSRLNISREDEPLLSDAEKQVLTKALQFDPKKRYQSVDEFAAAFRFAMENEVVPTESLMSKMKSVFLGVKLLSRRR